MRSSLIVGWIVALAACQPPATTACLRNSDCPAGQICTAGGSCEIAPDAGSDTVTDGGSAMTDAATSDAASAAQLAGDHVREAAP